MAQKLTALEFDQQFKYIKDIGQGTFGQVYAYEEIKNGRKLAVKKIVCYDFEMLSSSIQELTLLSRLSHKNIVKIYYYCMQKEELKMPGGKTDDQYNLYLFMELADYSVDFEVLERFKKNRYFSEKSLFFLVYDLTSALVFMQKIKVSHRDLKPHNILKIDGKYKLTDFGVSKKKINSQITNTVTGSPPYLAPQLFDNYQKRETIVVNNSYKSDCFSLGLVILGCALMKDISKCNENENLKNQRIEELKETQRYGGWLIQMLENVLQFEENKRWDFIQLNEFLQEVQQILQQNKLKLKSKQVDSSQSFTRSPDQEFSQLSKLVPTLLQKDLTIDTLNSNTRSDTLFNQTTENQQQNQDSNQKEKKEEIKNAKLYESDDENNPLTLAETFIIKINKFQKQNQNLIDIQEGKYKGDLNDQNKRHGKGEYLKDNHSFYYKGEWKNDHMHGYGEATWKEGKKYIGEWRQSERCGKGKQFYANGDIFEGEFLNNVKHGEGIFESKFCEKFKGSYKNGQKDGYGVFEYNDGTKYEGEWKNDKKHGYGKVSNSKGLIYEGEFQNNAYWGQGKLIQNNSKVLEGQFKNNLLEGDVKMYKVKSPEKCQVLCYSNGKEIKQ